LTFLKIHQDHARFRQIVKGRVRKELKKFISKGELFGREGGKTVSIPVPQIDIPRFRFGNRQQGGVGQGDGEPGDPMSQSDADDGAGQAGDQEGQHVIEVDVTIEELAEILGEELELPNLDEKGRQRVVSTRDRYVGIRRVGPESLRHFKRTYRQALKRQIASGIYDPKRPVIIPVRDDKRFRSWKTEEIKESNAVIIYMMDVSGSMGEEQKEIVRIESFWIDAWLTSQYEGLETRFIIHDAVAREVDRETFFHTRESGGTMISSAYKVCNQIIESDYPVSEWNIYPFHFSDGDNWSADDTKQSLELLEEKIIPVSNMFGYGQVHSPYGSGQFIRDVKSRFDSHDKVITSEIADRDGIMESIKTFLGKGK
jgi:sporulation protein YhbH